MKKIMFIVLSLIFFHIVCYALKVQIPKPYFYIEDTNLSKSFFIINNSKKMTAVEISVFSRIHSISGKESRINAENHFLVFPKQIILQPNEEQVCTIKYIGPKNIKQEKAYRVIVQELPLATIFEVKENDYAEIIIRFIKSIYVLPKNIQKHKIIIQNIKNTAQNKMELIIKNIGKQHYVIQKMLVSLIPKNKPENKRIITITKNQISEKNLLAGDTRKIILNWPKNFNNAQIIAKIISLK